MAKSSTEIRVGDVDVYLDMADGEGEQLLGYTLGGVDFIFEREFIDLLVDQFGSAPLDKALTGNKAKVKVKLAQPSNLNISRAIPEGAFSSAGDDSKLGFGSEAGQLMSELAGLLRLHPRSNDPSSRDEDIYLWKAVSVENIELPFKIDEQRILEITFEALVDDTQPAGQKLGRIGDVDIS